MIAQILHECTRQNIRLSQNGGLLRVQAPKGVLTPELKNALRAHKAEILHLLEINESLREHTEERSAVMEFDGGVNRKEAEQQAKKTRVYEYRLTDNPDIWLTKITPNYALNQAERSCRMVFGDRLIEVREYSQVNFNQQRSKYDE